MPTIYDIDFNQQASDLMPPDKRDPTYLSPMRALLKAIQWCRDLVLGNYRSGATAPAFGAGPYAKYDQVLYKKKVYYSLIDANTDTPDVITSWLPIQQNFIGVDERAQYDGLKLKFEYALNKWFATQFRQPTSFVAAPDYYLPKSDIYLITNLLPISVFRVGISEIESSSVGLLDSSEAVYDNYNFTGVYGLTIMVPVAVWTALSTVTADRDNIIRNFADKYVTAGVLYDIQTY